MSHAQKASGGTSILLIGFRLKSRSADDASKNDQRCNFTNIDGAWLARSIRCQEF